MGHSALGYDLNADAQIYWDWSRHLVTEHWRARNPFFFGPLYPYLLSILRVTAFDSVPRILILQSAWGAAACVLLADAARRLTRPAIGFLVGLVLAGYQMAIFMDAQILMESLLFFLEALLLWLVVVTDWGSARARTYGGIGLLLGVLALGRAVEAAILLVACAVLGRRRPSAIAMMIGVATLLALPALWHNHAATGRWIPYTYNSGYNFHVGNNPEATGSFVLTTNGVEPPPTKETIEGGVYADGREFLAQVTKRRPGYAESSALWARMAWDWIGSNPGRAVSLGLRKVAMLWNAREFPQIESPELYQEVAGPMGIPLLGSFGFLAVLACAGWWRLLRSGPAGHFLIGYAVVMTLAIVPFFVTDRYRIHLLPAVALAAASGIEWIVRSRRFLPAVACLLIGIMIISIPVPGRSAARIEWDSASELGSRWLRRGQLDRALSEFTRAVEVERSGRLSFPDLASVRSARASVYVGLGLTLRGLHRHAESVIWFRKAFELVPTPVVGRSLAMSQAMSGDLAAAGSTFDSIGEPRAEASRDLLLAAAEFQASGKLRNWRRCFVLPPDSNRSGTLPGSHSCVCSSRRSDWLAPTRHSKRRGPSVEFLRPHIPFIAHSSPWSGTTRPRRRPLSPKRLSRKLARMRRSGRCSTTCRPDSATENQLDFAGVSAIRPLFLYSSMRAVIAASRWS